jgi:hypothetical protein
VPAVDFLAAIGPPAQAGLEPGEEAHWRRLFLSQGTPCIRGSS